MSYRLEIKLAALLAAAIALAVWAGSRAPKPPPFDPRASTFRAGPEGSKALYQVLVRLGRPVERRRTPLFGFADSSRRRPALLVVLAPPMYLQPAELEQVVRFVEHGGAVVAAGSAGGVTECAGWRVQPRRGLGDSVAVRGPRGLNLPRAARTLAPDTASGRAGAEIERLAKRRRAREDDDGCERLAGERAAYDTLIAAEDGRPVVLRLTYDGGGTVILAADVGWFRNRTWRDTDVAQLVVPLLTPAGQRPGRVVWDEYHQGFGREGPSIAALAWDWLRASPAGWAILQLVAVGLVWLGVNAVRFGPARSVIERRRRSPLEHVEALAAGLASAAGTDTAVQLMVGGLRRRLSRAGTLTADVRQLSAWLGSLELAVPTTRGRQAVRALQRMVTQPGGPERVLDAAQAVEDVWEELRPRTTRDAF